MTDNEKTTDEKIGDLSIKKTEKTQKKIKIHRAFLFHSDTLIKKVRTRKECGKCDA